MNFTKIFLKNPQTKKSEFSLVVYDESILPIVFDFAKNFYKTETKILVQQNRGKQKTYKISPDNITSSYEHLNLYLRFTHLKIKIPLTKKYLLENLNLPNSTLETDDLSCKLFASYLEFLPTIKTLESLEKYFSKPPERSSIHTGYLGDKLGLPIDFVEKFHIRDLPIIFDFIVKFYRHYGSKHKNFSLELSFYEDFHLKITSTVDYRGNLF